MMKRKSLFRTFLAAMMSGFLFSGGMAIPAYARVTGTEPASTSPDQWCAGDSGEEVCVDFSGNLIPTTDNDTTLGTSSLRWATGYILDVTVGDDLTVTDDLTVNGDTTLGDAGADSLTINGSSSTINTWGLNFGTAPATGTSILMLDGANFRVGVNDTTPDAALDVGGSFQFDGNGTFGDAYSDTLTVNASSVTLNSTFGVRYSTATTGQIYFVIDTLNKTVIIPSASDIDDAITALAAGAMVRNSSTEEICYSTGTGTASWVKISTPSVACAN